MAPLAMPAAKIEVFLGWKANDVTELWDQEWFTNTEKLHDGWICIVEFDLRCERLTPTMNDPWLIFDRSSYEYLKLVVVFYPRAILIPLGCCSTQFRKYSFFESILSVFILPAD